MEISILGSSELKKGFKTIKSVCPICYAGEPLNQFIKFATYAIVATPKFQHKMLRRVSEAAGQEKLAG